MKQSQNVVSIPDIFSVLFISAVLCLWAGSAQDTAMLDQISSTYLIDFCSEYNHYDEGSEFQNNLNLLTSNFSANAKTIKFYNFTTGEGINRTYGLYLCNIFLSSQSCHDCISTAIAEIQHRCSLSKQYIGWYGGCMLRYADSPFFSINDNSIYYNLMSPTIEYDQFSQIVSKTLADVLSNVNAANASSPAGLSAVPVAEKVSLICYADCTHDLSRTDCNNCLQTALNRLPRLGAAGGILVQPNCRLMYGFSGTFTQQLGNLTTKALCKQQTTALGITSAIAAACLIFNICSCYMKRKKILKPTGFEDIERRENLHFEFEAIKAATENFSPENELGRGGFGVVYKGTLRDGEAIAVKRLSDVSRQGIREFRTEACLAAKLQHKNLVKVYGFCLKENEMLLVYEFVPSKSLDRVLFDAKQENCLPWGARYKIIVGIARGLQYLHEDSLPKIIHRDLKPSNILLDAETNPKIADFGLAKMFGEDQTHGRTNRVAGTFGYMAPEYVITGHFSNKSDIFSYGVILLEIISGTRNRCLDQHNSHENLLNYAWRLWNEGAHIELVDSELRSNFETSEAERCIQVGLMCIQEDPVKRPNIETVLQLLHTQPVSVLAPASPPAFPYRHENSQIIQRNNGNRENNTGGSNYTFSDFSPR